MKKRSIYCGLVTEELVGKEITLHGWVQKRRDHGGVIFIDLRDREGVMQVVFNPQHNQAAFEIADTLRPEYVIEVTGTVALRGEGLTNPNLKTGTMELEVHQVELLSKAKTPPIYIEDDKVASDELRMKYRYLDMRRKPVLENLRLRHKTTRAIREYLDTEGFIDVETPYLAKSTPEGARDYLVPSRVHEGSFYALPQSPQTFKQLLMGGGLDRYYQIVRCFRDEDLRGDRQPEFTQVDIETSFLSAEEIQEMMEGLLKKVMKDTLGVEVTTPFPRLSFAEAMSRYGNDKPDTRFALELIDVADIVKDSDLKVFSTVVENGGHVKALNLKGLADEYSRKDADSLAQFVAKYGAKGLAWLKVEEDGLKGPIAKFLVNQETALRERLDAEVGDIIFFCADKPSVVAQSLSELRLHFGRKHELIDQSKFNFLWVVDWPLLEYDEDANRYVAMHHPFTRPVNEDFNALLEDPAAAKAQAYDIVLNGYELGGGSLRIYRRDMQEAMFNVLGFTKESAQEQFGFLMDALDYGFPPHGGIALGLDRLVMLLAGEDNIREVIAFPKNGSAMDTMTQAPSPVSEQQLQELSLKIR
ncbi:aspartate--tRNA ligase [Granulicatella elegans]|uniref:Aspartate--tRNA(Asp/Asn) ligase n=1 Tax=Granulicatella elegans ATCC 700633 TaxID=626369 RepID=D0BKE5_9LACT|nr:aspartate--tRNA ligase [Granulicatella elegans]EEW93548.1 aspartate-tRNA ligase [Granulicatella elegans ATCC 700633]